MNQKDSADAKLILQKKTDMGINEENKSYASQIIAINNPEDIAKYTRQKEFNKQVEKIFDRLKSVITKIENSHGE